MEKHPFFMTNTPAEGEPLPPLLEGIQQLKYDPEENTSEGKKCVNEKTEILLSS
jgi:hypothetical protein